MQITKTFTFDSGHRLSNYIGKCRSLHGHTYKLEITIGGKINKLGMVMDFGDIKKLFKRSIDSRFDHKTLLFDKDPVNKRLADAIPDGEDWIVWVDYNPTAENIVKEIFNTLHDELKNTNNQLVKVKLWETPTSFAEISSM